MSITITGGFTFNGGGWTVTAAPPAAATAGWFSGGIQLPSYFSVTTVNRITYATDTSIATVRGPLSRSVYAFAGVGNNDYGWFGGGKPPPASTIDRIDYSNDTATSGVRGPLAAVTYTLAASSGVQ